MTALQRLKIISGGQTGVDRAALDAAIEIGLPHGGACPAGRAAEDGIINARYRLTETKSANPASRTRRNVRDSGATLILSPTLPQGGTRLTVGHAAKLNRPCLVLDPFAADAADEIVAWLRDEKPGILNIAGPRESKCPGLYARCFALLKEVFSAVRL